MQNLAQTIEPETSLKEPSQLSATGSVLINVLTSYLIERSHLEKKKVNKVLGQD